MSRELIVDNFAGGGGASTGIELALNRHVDIAINHDPEAIAMHKANHPHTRHFCEDVWDVDPMEATQGMPVGVAWFSPDCKHFSKAKGGQPKSKKIRGLAWIAIKWLFLTRPRVLFLENVEEFAMWGPLGPDGKPLKKAISETFKAFLSVMRNGIAGLHPAMNEIVETLGGAVPARVLERGFNYNVEYGLHRASDHDTPTIRKRLILIARCDERRIVWPGATCGDPKSHEVRKGVLKPWRTAAECIDWNIPCHSIFLSREDGRAVGVKRPLAEATMRRIARGVWRYVIDAAEPFIVTCNHSGNGFRGQGIHESFRTITGAHDAHGLVIPMLTEHSNGSKQRNFPIDEPMRTQCAEVKGGHFALVAAFLSKHYASAPGCDPREPMHTVKTVEHMELVTAHMVRQFGQSVGSGTGQPMGTIMPGGAGKTGLVTSHLMKMRGDNIGQGMMDPLQTVSAQGLHFAEVRAFLVKYYGSGGQDQCIDSPMHTIPTVDRIGLVMVFGMLWQIWDIRMRMLEPHELYRAQGFPRTYVIAPHINGKRLSKRSQVRMCGNSVCPPLAKAIVQANVPELRVERGVALIA